MRNYDTVRCTALAALTLLAACEIPIGVEGGGTWPYEPAGVTLLTDYSFSDPIPLVADGVVGQGWKVVNPDDGQSAVNGSAVSSTDSTAPMGSTVADFVYPIGMGGGVAPATMYFAHAAHQEVYGGFWWKPSASWQNHPSGVNKIAFWLMDNDNLSIQMFGPAPYKLHVVSELPNDSHRYEPNVTSTTITLGVWHRVEWHMTTAGLLEWWLDGVLQGRYTTVDYGWTPGFTMFLLSPTWGGLGGTKTHDDYYLYNAIHLSGR